MRKITKKTAVIVAGSALLVAVGGGVAFAYWSTTGSGTGTAATSTGNSNLAVAQTSVLGNLAPGVSPSTISGTITNNATNNAYVHTVTASIASVTLSPTATGTCDATDYSLASPTVTINTDLTPGQVVTFSGPTLAFNDKTGTNQDGCKGATVNLAYATN